ncbi:hypothetical protein V8F20_001379 [Naviculisporaceae sp. PSN 640]
MTRFTAARAHRVLIQGTPMGPWHWRFLAWQPSVRQNGGFFLCESQTDRRGARVPCPKDGSAQTVPPQAITVSGIRKEVAKRVGSGQGLDGQQKNDERQVFGCDEVPDGGCEEGPSKSTFMTSMNNRAPGRSVTGENVKARFFTHGLDPLDQSTREVQHKPLFGSYFYVPP